MEFRQRQNKFNLRDDKCEWPTHIHNDATVRGCDFKFKLIHKLENGAAIVKLPKDSTLYHTTISNVKSEPWWINTYPNNQSRGGVFFTQSLAHQAGINGTHTLTYKTKRGLQLLFIRNITKKYGVRTGNDFLSSGLYKSLVYELEPKYGAIHGFIGCNECEVFINNEDVAARVIKKPLNVVDKRKFID